MNHKKKSIFESLLDAFFLSYFAIQFLAYLFLLINK